MDFFIYVFIFCVCFIRGYSNIITCGGFIKSEFQIDFSRVKVHLTEDEIVKFETFANPNGYYIIPVYDVGAYTIRISSPFGWNFHNTSYKVIINRLDDECTKQKNIDFYFSGFSISGQVVDYTSGKGLQLVEVLLHWKAGLKQTIYTDSKGMFLFTSIFPGRYTVQAFHESWRFSNNNVSFEISTDSFFLLRPIQLLGYNIYGRVITGNVDGVNVSLRTDANIVSYICEVTVSNAVCPCTFTESQGTLCLLPDSSMLSDGHFAFHLLPNGRYNISVSSRIFGVSQLIDPAFQEFTINHGDVWLRNNFLVQGFLLRGNIRVDKSLFISSLPTISLDDHTATVDITDMTYTFTNISLGVYSLTVQTDLFSVAQLSVNISATSSMLPDIIADGYRVCGAIKIELSHISSDFFPRTLEFRENSSFVVNKLTSSNGTFCHILPIGVYTAYVLPKNDDDKNYVFGPKTFTVTNRSIDSLVFTLTRVSIFVKIHCLELNCSDVFLTIVAKSSKSADYFTFNRSTDENNNVLFENLFPMTYVIRVNRPSFCWSYDETEVSFDINSRHQSDNDTAKFCTFHQTGYRVYISSVNSTLGYIDPQGARNSISVNKSINSLCLPSQGEYVFTLCHYCQIFEPSELAVFVSSASNVNILDNFTLSSYQITAYIHMMNRSLTHSTSGMQCEVFDSHSGLFIGRTMLVKVSGTVSDTFMCRTNISAAQDISWHIVHTGMYYMQPQVVALDSSDIAACRVANFSAYKSWFIHGSVSPKIAHVQIDLLVENVLNTTLYTDEYGSFSFGPFNSSLLYSLKAFKDGYEFSLADNNSFIAHKLSVLNITIVSDIDGSLIDGVLVSVSANNGYLNNQITNRHGYITHFSILDGDYFIRPLMKEYKFQPEWTDVRITNGQSEYIAFTATRIGYSYSGRTCTFGDVPVPHISLQATSTACANHTETTTSRSDGTFTIMALRSQCRYDISLRSASKQMYRQIPALKSITIVGSDIDSEVIHLYSWPRHTSLNILVARENESVSLDGMWVHVHALRPSTRTMHLSSLAASPSVFVREPVALHAGEVFVRVLVCHTCPSRAVDVTPAGVTVVSARVRLHPDSTFCTLAVTQGAAAEARRRLFEERPGVRPGVARAWLQTRDGPDLEYGAMLLGPVCVFVISLCVYHSAAISRRLLHTARTTFSAHKSKRL